jgi:hypothetical protein
VSAPWNKKGGRAAGSISGEGGGSRAPCSLCRWNGTGKLGELPEADGTKAAKWG